VTTVAHLWGTTAPERARPFPCDGLLDGASDVLFRAVDVDAPASVVFRWLCQMRVAPYSYDCIDNFGRRSPRRLTPGLDTLRVGQRFMGFFELVEFESGRHLTLLLRSPAPDTLLGRIAVSYTVVSQGARGSRLLVKMLVQYPPGPFGWAMRRLLPWGDLVMMRKQLLTLKELAEAQCSRPSS